MKILINDTRVASFVREEEWSNLVSNWKNEKSKIVQVELLSQITLVKLRKTSDS